MISFRILVATPLAIALSGCLASQNDIRVLQSDLSLLRSEQSATAATTAAAMTAAATAAATARAASDSTQRVQIDRVLASLRAATDSINALNTRMTRFRSDMSTSMASVDQQLLAIQELTGQSQRRLQEVRTSLEDRTQPSDPTGSTSAPGNAAEPGPLQLFQVAREQMMQGSNQAARQAFEDLLVRYPKSDVASDALFYIAETYAAENNPDTADSVYASVVKQYANSPRAATALYKRGVVAQTADKADKARSLFNELIKKYPRSDEAALARDRVKQLGK